MGPPASGRELLADWVTAPENPYFARAAVNRVWARFFGTGLVDPVDDLGDDNPPSHPELLDVLADQFRSHGYDLKFLIRAITATRAYGLTSAVGRSEPAPANLFAAMPVRTLSPGQLYETLAQATGFRERLGGGDAIDAGTSARAVRRAVRQPRREADRGADVDPPGARPDERPAHGQRDEPGDQRDPRRRGRGPLPRHPRADRDALPRRPDPPAPARRAGAARAVRRARRHRAATRPQALADVFWALLNSPEFRFNH